MALYMSPEQARLSGLDLQTWIPLQTNLLGSGPLYFSDPHTPANVQRFYRVQLSP
jgi:hypothetical protein